MKRKCLRHFAALLDTARATSPKIDAPPPEADAVSSDVIEPGIISIDAMLLSFYRGTAVTHRAEQSN